MNKRKTGFILILLFTIVLGLLYPQNQVNKQKTKDSQIEGEVVDLTCYTSRGLSGAGHKACATRCLTRGAPAGLVDQDGNIFVIMAKVIQSLKSHNASEKVISTFTKEIISSENYDGALNICLNYLLLHENKTNI